MSRWQRVAWWVAPMLLCLVVHWHDFSSWFSSDDFAWLALGLPQHGLHEYLHAIFAPMAQGTIRPWSERLFFMLGFRLFGLDATPFRIVIFATQFANLALVAWIGTRLTGRRAAGFLAAILWTVSDTTVEPLGWASAYNQVLCAFFLLLAFQFLLRYVETGAPHYNLYQWIAFLLGFGALELNVVYPALAAVYAFLYARKYLRNVWPLFVPSIAYAAIHLAVAPPGKDPNYAMHYTSGMLRTLAKYWAWTVGPVGFWTPVPLAHWLMPAAVLAISLGLLAFALRSGGRMAIFCLAWFVILIAPVLPLRDHVSDYYAFLPAVGLCWLAGWALAGTWRTAARYPALALAALYLLIMVPRTVAAAGYNDRTSARARDLVEGVARAHQLHPSQTILLDGVDTELFYDAVLDHPFRLLGIDRVYLTPGSEAHIDSHPELGDVGQFVLPSDAVARALDAGELAVYDVRGPRLRNITSSYAAQPRDLSLPHRVDVANPLATPLLGPEWYAPEGNHRWMPARASLRLAGPAAPGEKLFLRGYYPAGEIQHGPVSVRVTVNGTALPAASISTGGDFELSFPLPAAVVGKPAMEVAVEVSRTFRAGSDIRDLGLTFGEFEVR